MDLILFPSTSPSRLDILHPSTPRQRQGHDPQRGHDGRGHRGVLQQIQPLRCVARGGAGDEPGAMSMHCMVEHAVILQEDWDFLMVSRDFI